MSTWLRDNNTHLNKPIIVCKCDGMVCKNGVCQYVKVQVGSDPCGCGAPKTYECEHKQDA